MSKKVIFISIIFLLVILIITGALVIKNNMDKASVSKPATIATKQDLEQTMKQTFTNPKDQDILKYISFASADKTLGTKFTDYSKAYQLIYKRYQNSATTQIKEALVKFRNFLKPFPQYNEADFKLL